jgi:ATP-dependent DNA helicase RecG
VSQLPQREVIDGPLRRRELLVPEVAVREAIANSLIHQDFTARGARVMIEIYDRRVEISNPGDPVVAVDRFIDSYRSRNEQLADLMRRLHICEEKSSGVDRVVRAAEEHHLPAPDFRSGAERTTTVLFGALPFAETNRAERVRATYQHCVLLWIVGQRMTNSTLRQRFGLGERQSPTVSAVISATVKAGLIRPDEGGGQRKKAGYLPYWA